MSNADIKKPRRLFLVAGEHSGDALGAALMRAFKKHEDGAAYEFVGVGGEEMATEGLTSLYPLSDIAVMGPKAILAAFPTIYRRVLQTVDAIEESSPDALVIIDSPEFTHPIAKRIKKRMPDLPVIDYVSPSVWAWRPGRARRMRGYIDLVLALLPFEPAAHQRLGGPKCVYVGHPLSQRVDEVRGADGNALKGRLGIAADQKTLLVLPGSRRSEVSHLIDVFGETVAELAQKNPDIAVLLPAVSHLRETVFEKTRDWAVQPHILTGAADKYAAMTAADAALAASGTVTLELALAGTPSIVAYKVDRIMEPLRILLKVQSVVLANLVLERNVFPEFLQERCTAELMAPALEQLMAETPERKAQLEALQEVPTRLEIEATTPAAEAANAIQNLIEN